MGFRLFESLEILQVQNTSLPPLPTWVLSVLYETFHQSDNFFHWLPIIVTGSCRFRLNGWLYCHNSYYVCPTKFNLLNTKANKQNIKFEKWGGHIGGISIVSLPTFPFQNLSKHLIMLNIGGTKENIHTNTPLVGIFTGTSLFWKACRLKILYI